MEKKVDCPSMPAEIWRFHIAPYLDLTSLNKLSRTCKTLDNTLNNSKGPIVQRGVAILLGYVVQGKQDEAEALLQKKPSFLLYKGNITDYSGRTFEGVTAFQCALYTHDVEMWQMMEPYFKKLNNGQEEKAKQFNKIFPNGKLPAQTRYNFVPLVKVINDSPAECIALALAKQQNETPLCKALNRFREEFKALSLKEYYYNPRNLVGVLSIYIMQFKHLQWSLEQRDLFWRQVVGYVQRYEPACYAQALCQGLYSLKKEEALQRSLDFKYGECGGQFYPVSSISSDGLGFDFAMVER